MKVAVDCGSKSGSPDIFIEAAKRLGAWLGENGHTLVYGGGNTGLMGAVSDAALATGGEVIGVLPTNVPLIKGRRHEGLTAIIDTPTMAERKSEMIRLADAFIALPGGIGTLDEITEVMALTSLGVFKAPVVFFDTDGYYDSMKAVLKDIVSHDFARDGSFDNVYFTDDLDEIGAVFAEASDAE